MKVVKETIYGVHVTRVQTGVSLLEIVNLQVVKGSVVVVHLVYMNVMGIVNN